MTEPLFLKPVFHEKIWGGRRLAEDFNYDIPDGTIGECWAISGHPHGPNVIENGEFKGQLLPDVYANHPEVFGNPKSKVFPLLTKILMLKLAYQFKSTQIMRMPKNTSMN